MRFWDASAIVPLLFSERWSEPIRKMFREDPAMVVWWGSRVECVWRFGAGNARVSSGLRMRNTDWRS